MNNVLRRSKLFLDRNAATILTTVGGIGVVATSVLAVRATPKALQLIEESKEEKGGELTKIETALAAAPAYIPSVIVGVSTIACIFGANVLNKRKQAALMSAYALLDSSYKTYKNKVLDLYGEEADNKVTEEIAKDEYEEDTSVEDGKMLFYDTFSNRYFESTIEDVQRAEYQVNRDLALHYEVSLNKFYDLLGVPRIEAGDAIGWSVEAGCVWYGYNWIDFDHKKVVIDDDLECRVIKMVTPPTADYQMY